MDLVDGLKYAFSAFGEKKFYPSYFLLAVVSLAYIIGSIVAPGIYLLLMAAYTVFLWYMVGKFSHFKLSQEGLASSAYDFPLFIQYAITNVTQLLHVLSFWRDKKWLIIYAVPIAGFFYLSSVVGALFEAASPVSAEEMAATISANISLVLPPAALLLAGLGITAIAWLYHSYRLAFMGQAKLCDPSLDAGGCSQRSWGITHKKVLRLFLFNLALGICLGVPIFIIAYICGLLYAGALTQAIVQGTLAALTYGASAFFIVYLYKCVLLEAGEAQQQAAKAKPAKNKKRK